MTAEMTKEELMSEYMLKQQIKMRLKLQIKAHERSIKSLELAIGHAEELYLMMKKTRE